MSWQLFSENMKNYYLAVICFNLILIKHNIVCLHYTNMFSTLKMVYWNKRFRISHIVKFLCEREHLIGLSKADVYLEVLRKCYKWKKVLITVHSGGQKFILIVNFHKGTCPTTSLSSSVLTYKANSHCTDRRRPTPTVNRLQYVTSQTTFSDSTSSIGEIKRQLMPTDVTHNKTSFGLGWRLNLLIEHVESSKTWRTFLLPFVCVCQCTVNRPLENVQTYERFVIPVAVIVKFIVARKGNEDSKPGSQRKENLSSCINPYLQQKKKKE